MAKKRRGQSAAFMRSINPNIRKSRSTKRGQNTRMARRNRRSRKSRRMFGSSKSGIKPLSLLLGGGIYGAVRQKASDALAPITSKIPLGNLSDEALLFGLGYLVHKKVSNKIVKDIALSAMAVESARMGEAIITGQVGLGSSSSNSSSSTLLG